MIRHFTNQLFGYGFVAYKQSKNLNFVFSGFFFDVSTRCKKLLEVKRVYYGFSYLHKHVFREKFSLVKESFWWTSDLFIGQQ